MVLLKDHVCDFLSNKYVYHLWHSGFDNMDIYFLLKTFDLTGDTVLYP